MKRALQWMKNHKIDVAMLTVVVAISSVFSAVNMTSYPQRFEDEGTYVSQALAVKNKGDLAHYTYWYDHPPVAWIQIAGYFTLTDALDRYDSAIIAGREFMLVLHVISIILLFALARRLGVGSVAAGAGTLLYGLSPLAVEFSRYVFLDNVALPWLLGAFLLALSPKKTVGYAVLSAVCMVIAIMSKETFAALLPVFLYAIWTNSDVRNRRYSLTAFAVVFILSAALYPLYAVLKGELLPGEGHVSLFGTLLWQLFGREGSGSIIESTSGSRDLVKYWLNIDVWLLAAGVLSLPIALFQKHMRIAAAALLIGIALLFRSGYLPYPYIIMVLPFAALTFSAAVQAALKNIQLKSFVRLSLAQGFFIICAAATVFLVYPDWRDKARASTSVDLDFSSRQVIDWVGANVDRDSRMVVESALWSDLETQGFDQPEPVWLYKTETDPAIVDEIGGWENIDYVILNGPTVGNPAFAAEFLTVSTAIKNAEVLREFGADNQKVIVYKVIK